MKLFSLNHSARLCRTEISSSRSILRRRPIGAAWRSLKAFAVMAGLPLAVTTAPLQAANGPTVTVDGVVEVQGAVEVVNDVLNTPYAKVNFRQFSQQGINLGFDIPEGKRLVIETIGFVGNVPAGQRFSVRLSAVPFGEDDFAISIPVPVQFEYSGSNVFDGYIAGMPMKVRVDSKPGNTAEVAVNVSRSDATGSGDCTISICGYLVDL